MLACSLYSVMLHRKRKSNPITGLASPRGFQQVEAPRFQDSRHMKVLKLSALRTGRLYLPKKYSWYSFLLEAESTPGPQCGQKDYYYYYSVCCLSDDRYKASSKTIPPHSAIQSLLFQMKVSAPVLKVIHYVHEKFQ